MVFSKVGMLENEQNMSGFKDSLGRGIGVYSSNQESGAGTCYLQVYHTKVMMDIQWREGPLYLGAD